MFPVGCGRSPRAADGPRGLWTLPEGYGCSPRAADAPRGLRMFPEGSSVSVAAGTRLSGRTAPAIPARSPSGPSLSSGSMRGSLPRGPRPALQSSQGVGRPSALSSGPDTSSPSVACSVILAWRRPDAILVSTAWRASWSRRRRKGRSRGGDPDRRRSLRRDAVTPRLRCGGLSWTASYLTASWPVVPKRVQSSERGDCTRRGEEAGQGMGSGGLSEWWGGGRGGTGWAGSLTSPKPRTLRGIRRPGIKPREHAAQRYGCRRPRPAPLPTRHPWGSVHQCLWRPIHPCSCRLLIIYYYLFIYRPIDLSIVYLSIRDFGSFLEDS